MMKNEAGPRASANPRIAGRTRTARTRTVVAGLAALGIALLGASSGAVTASAASSTPNPSSTVVPTAPLVSTAEATAEGALVADEDRRLIELRAVTATASAKGTQWQSPYRVNTGSGYTLILTARAAPYQFSDLLTLEPETLLLQPDGSYVLSESIYIARGATLDLSTTTGLTLKMLSDPSGFASIVSFGGNMIISGTAQHPVNIMSWDPQTQSPETDVAQGRAYIRGIGGQFRMSYANVTDLGFWSGRTGGISLTGTTRPSAGSTSGPTPTTSTGGSGSGTATGQTPVTTSPAGSGSGTGDEFSVPGMSYVSAEIDHSTITGDAFGLFVSTAQGVAISDTTVTGSLVEGIDLHRLTTQVEIQNVVANQNDGPGFDVSRAAQQVQIADSTADYNLGNGFTVNGEPISQGASASGEPLGSYGNNSITSSTAQGNSHYGIEVLGGLNITLNKNTIIGNQMGIVVSKATQTISIFDNNLEQQDREGIAIIDGVQSATVTGNQIQGAITGIYVRGSVVDLSKNSVGGASLHGITMLGPDAGSLISGNTVAGSGVSAIDTERVTGKIAIGANTTTGWQNTTPLLKRIKAMIRPLTLVWLSIFTLLAIAAYRNRRTRTGKGKRHIARRAALVPGRHPYTNQFILAVTPPKALDEVMATASAKPRRGLAKADMTVTAINPIVKAPVVKSSPVKVPPPAPAPVPWAAATPAVPVAPAKPAEPAPRIYTPASPSQVLNEVMSATAVKLAQWTESESAAEPTAAEETQLIPKIPAPESAAEQTLVMVGGLGDGRQRPRSSQPETPGKPETDGESGLQW